MFAICWCNYRCTCTFFLCDIDSVVDGQGIPILYPKIRSLCIQQRHSSWRRMSLVTISMTVRYVKLGSALQVHHVYVRVVYVSKLIMVEQQ